MLPKHLPSDINAEELLLFLKGEQVRVSLCGSHKRDAYNDIVGMEETADGALTISLARNSIYNVLPEYMFHPIDRFDNIPANETKERFAEELKAQEEEKENARQFFAPMDLLLLRLKCEVREAMQKYAQSDIILENALTDTLTEEQRNNRFIKRALPFMPSCRYIRGNNTLITLMLRKILEEEGVNICLHQQSETTIDEIPRYHYALGEDIKETYVGNAFDEEVLCYDIHYWSDEDCDEHFLAFIDEVEMFRQFVSDYFLSVEDAIKFDIVKDEATLRLSDIFVYNYLNYSSFGFRI